MEKSKYVLKIILSFILAISVFTPFNVKAYEIVYPGLDIYVGTVDMDTNKYGGIYFGPEENTGELIAWGFNLTNKAVYSYGLSFYVDLNPGETISLSYDYIFENIYPISTLGYSFTVFAISDEFSFEIDLPETGVNCDNYYILNEAVDGYIASECENFTYTNETAKKIHKIVFQQTLTQSQNHTFALFKVNAAYYTKKSSDLIEQENNAFLGGIFDKISGIFEEIKGNGSDKTNQDLNNKNNQFNSSADEYLQLEDTFNDNLNDSLNNIDLNVDLYQGGQFLNAATFISTNVNRIVTSNPYYESFIMTGLIFGLALFLIGKRVI